MALKDDRVEQRLGIGGITVYNKQTLRGGGGGGVSRFGLAVWR